MQREMNRIFSRSSLPRGAIAGPSSSGASSGSGADGDNTSLSLFSADWHPRCDLSETEGGLHIEAELPGVDKQDVKLEIDGDILTLSPWTALIMLAF